MAPSSATPIGPWATARPPGVLHSRAAALTCTASPANAWTMPAPHSCITRQQLLLETLILPTSASTALVWPYVSCAPNHVTTRARRRLRPLDVSCSC